MNLYERLTADMKAAMKAKDVTTLDVIRMTLSSIKNKAIELNKELADADVMAVIAADLKKIKDAMQSFIDNARHDLADKAKTEIAILEKYLPTQLTDGELEQKVKAKIEELGVKASTEAGKVMGVLSKELKGLADGSRIKQMVDKLLK